MNRIINFTPQDSSWLSDDSRLAELVHEAEKRRSRWRNAADVAGAWLLLIAVSGVLWYGVLRAIGAL